VPDQRDAAGLGLERRGSIVTGGHAITAAALANCLGTDSRTVFERAYAGAEVFSPASAFYAFPFPTMLGVMQRTHAGGTAAEIENQSRSVQASPAFLAAASRSTERGNRKIPPLGAREIRARIAALAPLLEPVMPAATEAWMLSTRIVQRRALRVSGCSAMPIRKFALQLVVEPVRGLGPSGRSTVTAFLQPHAELTEVWSLARPSDDPAATAIARVTFTGIPSRIGRTKDTVVLLTAGLCDADNAESYV